MECIIYPEYIIIFFSCVRFCRTLHFEPNCLFLIILFFNIFHQESSSKSNWFMFCYLDIKNGASAGSTSAIFNIRRFRQLQCSCCCCKTNQCCTNSSASNIATSGNCSWNHDAFFTHQVFFNVYLFFKCNNSVLRN